MLEIYGTLGPSCADARILKDMINAGMSAIRLNLSHGPLKNHLDWMDELHQAMKETGKNIPIAIDLQGRELRIMDLKKPVTLEEGQTICLGTDIPVDSLILDQIQEGVKVQIDDGKILLQTLRRMEDGSILCDVLRPGKVESRKSLYLIGQTINLSPLTHEDLANLQLADSLGIDRIMVPFVQERHDLLELKKALEKIGFHGKILAKIENRKGMENIEEIARECDMIVIARGDLANDIGLINIARGQEWLEKKCHALHQPYMVVTEMLNGMRTAPSATRAEINDVYWAVKLGANAIMLTGETASGQYPQKAMETFVQAAQSALDALKEETAQASCLKTVGID